MTAAAPAGPAVIGTAQHVADLVGAFAFAVSGALLAVNKGYDVFGVAVLACATAFGGGVIRDLIIDKGTPVAFVDHRYLWTSLLAAVLIYFIHPPAKLVGLPLEVADAVGLGLFCVTGTLTAYRNGLDAVSAAVLGVVTAVGGGVIRDLLARRTPLILRPDQEIYAVPALIGATITATALGLHHYNALIATLAVITALAVRLLALRFHWHAPRADPRPLTRPPRPPTDR
jgi:uncharacterized membrane protein YeiH